MIALEEHPAPPKGHESGPTSPLDLIDFYRRWPEFRPLAQALTQCVDLAEAEREIVYWCITVLDRISERDLRSPKAAIEE